MGIKKLKPCQRIIVCIFMNAQIAKRCSNPMRAIAVFFVVLAQLNAHRFKTVLVTVKYDEAEGLKTCNRNMLAYKVQKQSLIKENHHD